MLEGGYQGPPQPRGGGGGGGGFNGRDYGQRRPVADPLAERPDLRCRLCHRAFRHPVTTECCSSNFCEECLHQAVFEHNACPTCQTPLPAENPGRRNVRLQAAVEQFLNEHGLSASTSSSSSSSRSSSAAASSSRPPPLTRSSASTTMDPPHQAQTPIHPSGNRSPVLPASRELSPSSFDDGGIGGGSGSGHPMDRSYTGPAPPAPAPRHPQMGGMTMNMPINHMAGGMLCRVPCFLAFAHLAFLNRASSVPSSLSRASNG
jgi:hypothetical protein